MSNTHRKAVVFWLSGGKQADLCGIAEVRSLVEQGALVALLSSPITSVQACHHQLMTGCRPECSGFFDTLVLDRYSVVEEATGRDRPPASLIDLLRKANWTITFKETTVSELVTDVQAWVQQISPSSSCLLIKCTVHTTLTDLAKSSIGDAVSIAQAAVGNSGLLAIVSDAQAASVKSFVNLNNFLAAMGMIERDEQNGSIDWSNTVAYFMGHGQLWINLEGRDEQGLVSRVDEYEEVREILIRALPMKIRDPQTGEPVIERVYRKEELYHGDYLFCAPDLIVVFASGYAPSAKSTRLDFDHTTFMPANGVTTLNGANPASTTGFLLAVAPFAFEQGITIADAAPLTAVAPTLLHALEVKHGPMDNEALAGVFLPYYLDLHPIRTAADQQTLSDEEEELVINRLRDLGYI